MPQKPSTLAFRVLIIQAARFGTQEGVSVGYLSFITDLFWACLGPVWGLFWDCFGAVWGLFWGLFDVAHGADDPVDGVEAVVVVALVRGDLARVSLVE